MPPPQTVSDHDLLTRLADLFRTVGFEGASLGRISEAAGLQRSSLYHRFPGGKDEMAEQVVRHVGDVFGSDILAPAFEEDVPVASRIAAIAANLRRFYGGGAKACLIEVLSIEGTSPTAREGLGQAAEAWIEVFARLAREAGIDRRRARLRGEDAVARLEGALVLARATGSTAAFERALRHLDHDLTAP